jgi:hypothetical protein
MQCARVSLVIPTLPVLSRVPTALICSWVNWVNSDCLVELSVEFRVPQKLKEIESAFKVRCFIPVQLANNQKA